MRQPWIESAPDGWVEDMKVPHRNVRNENENAYVIYDYHDTPLARHHEVAIGQEGPEELQGGSVTARVVIETRAPVNAVLAVIPTTALAEALINRIEKHRWDTTIGCDGLLSVTSALERSPITSQEYARLKVIEHKTSELLPYLLRGDVMNQHSAELAEDLVAALNRKYNG